MQLQMAKDKFQRTFARSVKERLVFEKILEERAGQHLKTDSINRNASESKTSYVSHSIKRTRFR